MNYTVSSPLASTKTSGTIPRRSPSLPMSCLWKAYFFSYFIVFPITFRFLANYQVEKSVENLISLESYIDTLVFLSLAMGLVFEIPILSWLLGRLGILHREQMLQYRRHAIVIILVIAAIITPTSDAFTLAIVSAPMYLLYEVSILLVPRSQCR